MLSIFQNLEYAPAESKTEGTPLHLIVINNPDGTPRWLCPVKAPKPYFLKFYNISGFKSRLFAFLCQSVFLLRLQSIVFNTKVISLLLNKQEDESIINLFKNNWAIFTGTPGPNNKALVYQEGNAGNRFFKIAQTPQASRLISQEAAITEKLTSLNIQSFSFPHTRTVSHNILQLEDVSAFGRRHNRVILTHIAALNELYEKTTSTLHLEEIAVIQDSKKTLKALQTYNDDRIPNGLVKKLEKLYQSLENKPVQVAWSHGDFTPWNMYAGHDKLFTYDWELAQTSVPIGFDAFHFVVQQGILVERKPWWKIKKEIIAQISQAFSVWTKNDGNTWTDYLKYYLLINTSKYLNIYRHQPRWHQQIHWLLQTWNEAISDVLQYEENNRRLLILDTFDFLAAKDYAAVKFPDKAPELLNTDSDIDLCIEKKDLKSMIQFLKNHPLTSHLSIIRKSFMATIQVFLIDGSILCLDLIWKIKRKSLVMMNAAEVIKNAVNNEFGVKQMAPQDLGQYVGLFYGLNNQKIPDKYKPHVLVLTNGNNTLDQLLFDNAVHDKIQQQELMHLMKKEKENKASALFINTLYYFLDTFRLFLLDKGMIITFSGVDGVGKSTVIAKTKREIEKKLRKRVVVLRHRPSILPILSAWIKGKVKAEQDAAHTLPRQGKNKSSLSSLLRFAYYYADYLFGQFYVYFRYVCRGYVVLYDRYYFDFINDSKRSNIQLPKKLAQIGYRFLIKPDLNFFLYADPDTILQRKQELDKTTIINLTDQYLALFEKLGKGTSNRYFPVENTVLDTTIDYIMQKTIVKAA